MNFELEDKALNLEALGAEVKEQANLDAGGFQVMKYLLFVDRG